MKKDNNEKHEIYAEFLSERIYGSLTLLAVNIGLLINIRLLTLGHAYAVIIYTTLGLWAASLFAYYTSYRIVHNKSVPKRNFIRSLVAHRGIIVAAMPSIILLTVAATGFIRVETALLIDVVLAAASMLIMFTQSLKHAYSSITDKIVSVSVQIIIAAIIIGFKLAVH